MLTNHTHYFDIFWRNVSSKELKYVLALQLVNFTKCMYLHTFVKEVAEIIFDSFFLF